MPSNIELSKDAFDLWQKMLERAGPVKNTELKTLLGKPVGAPLREELLTSNLIKQTKAKPLEYQAVPGDQSLACLGTFKHSHRKTSSYVMEDYYDSHGFVSILTIAKRE